MSVRRMERILTVLHLSPPPVLGPAAVPSHCTLSLMFSLPYPVSQRAVPAALHSRQSPAEPSCGPPCRCGLSSELLPAPGMSVYCSLCSAVRSTVSGHLLYHVRSLWSSPVLCRSLWSSPSPVISCTVSAVSGHLLYRVRSLWSSPVPCTQSLVISCTMSAVSGHLLYCVCSLWSSLYYVCSLWSSPVPCPQSLVISCTMSAVSDHLLYYVRSLWSSPVLCLQSLVIPWTVSAVPGHLL
ncbi:unnamed protein product [Staurois parvus]|uniref:Uncharacterized protein n=1 Tax=Staurois parvus TaxID=386267 RepID=A0ABN9CIN9_9NEOB|nr:unnamed protein product [Staurois parvus]